jgi:hypothetical protein
MYKYNEIIFTLIDEFKEMKKVYDDDKDYFEGIPYVIYESEFVPFIVDSLNNNDEIVINKVFKFVEDLLKHGDERVVNLVEVAIVESLFLDECIDDKDKIIKHFGDLTLRSYKSCELGSM